MSDFMYVDLNEKQIEIFEFIKEQQLLKGYPPSVREICAAVGLKSTSTVHGHLNKLEKLGYIRRDPTKPRAIEILDGGNVFANNNNTVTYSPSWTNNCWRSYTSQRKHRRIFSTTCQLS